jgi:hypothetical protein
VVSFNLSEKMLGHCLPFLDKLVIILSLTTNIGYFTVHGVVKYIHHRPLIIHLRQMSAVVKTRTQALRSHLDNPKTLFTEQFRSSERFKRQFDCGHWELRNPAELVE